MKKKIVTLGELMLRLSPPGYERFVQADTFQVEYGGGEANVAASLAAFGHDACFLTKLPKHEIGQAAVNFLKRYGVGTDFVARGGDRIGVYYLEKGASVRPSKVIYDRAGSAIAEAVAEDFDFDAIFRDADWFHFTGITPALGEKAARLTKEALTAAKRSGVTVSVDLNYRKKLWSEAQAQACMKPLMEYVDVCIGNEEDAEKVLGFKPGNTDVSAGRIERAGYESIFHQMKDAFGFKYVATTLRESRSASDNGWSALIYDGKEFYSSRKYDLHIVDRVGGGDAFAAGLIHGLLDENMNAGEALEFAVAASALKHTIEGDFNPVTPEEVMALAGGDASGRVQR